MLSAIVQGLRGRRRRSSDLIEEALRRADEAAAADVFTLRFDAAARKLARAADAAREAGGVQPYLGIPITVKDNIDLAGLATTAGSMLLRDAAPAPKDAEVVRRLRDAGFIVLGRTNMTEFAFSGLGLNPHYGTPRNPAFPAADRIPGGSSSGAAVSVALGIAAFSIGTDTGGSIRVPAALCGLVGFKPTAARVNQRGVLPLSPTLDSLGVIAKSVDCCASAFTIIAESVETDLQLPPSLKGVRLAVIDNYVSKGIEAQVASSFERAVDQLSQAGAIITRLKIPALDGIPGMHAKGTLSGTEAFAWHCDHIAANAGAYDPRVLERIKAGSSMSADEYVELQANRRRFIADVEAQARDFDALLAPTVPVIAPRITDLAAEESYFACNALMLRGPSIVNLFDGCAISIPCQEAGRPPVGLSLIGLGGRDRVLLGLAGAAEAVISPPHIRR